MVLGPWRATDSGARLVIGSGFSSRRLAPIIVEGIQGFGSETTGGAGGTVYYVTSGANSGAGTLREYLENRTGNRTIVFDGVNDVELTGSDTILVNDGNVTIAGQTAGGVQVRGASLNIGDCPNVIMMGMMLRPGVDVNNMDSGGIRILTSPTETRFWIKNCSMMWSEDECFPITGDVQNVTIEECIIGQGLFANQYGTLLSTPNSVSPAMPTKITYLRNLLCCGKSPRTGGWLKQAYEVEFINNYVYEPTLLRDTWRVGNLAANDSTTSHNARANFINNVVRSGPGTDESVTSGSVPKPIRYWNDTDKTGRLYISGNLVYLENGSTVSEPHYWDSVGTVTSLGTPDFDSGITPMNASEVEAYVLARVGATPPAYGFTRDTVEGRLITAATNHTTGLATTVAGAGGYATMPTPPSITDSDADGIPDDQEATWGSDLQGYLRSFYD